MADIIGHLIKVVDFGNEDGNCIKEDNSWFFQ